MASSVYCELLGMKWLLGPSAGEITSWWNWIMALATFVAKVDLQVDLQDSGLEIWEGLFAKSASTPHGSAGSEEMSSEKMTMKREAISKPFLDHQHRK
jgi:hypothetical protein